MVPDVVGPEGEPGAVNIFTCTPTSLRWARQNFGFWRSRQSQWRARSYTLREAGSFTLQRLDILHSATWLRLGHFPALTGSRQEQLRHVLFCSNFAGSWDAYRQAFLDVLGKGIRSLWGPSLHFPRFPGPGTRYQVEEWIRHRLPPTLHYYRAYPGLAPSEVRGAVRLARQLESFAFNLDAGGVALSPDARLTAFRQVQRRISDSLSATPPGIVRGATLGPAGATGMSNFVSLLPILPGREADVVARIALLPRGSASPFRRVEGTHFARLAILDRRKASFHPRSPIVLRNSWLLFAADIDGQFGVREERSPRMQRGEINRYADAIDRTPGLRDIWKDCVGFRRDRPLADLVIPSVIERFILFLDHGDTTLREIDRALKLKHDYMTRLERRQLDDEAGMDRLLDRVRATGVV